LGQKLTTIKISVPNETDEVFIVGNQKSLGDWKPNKVKMKKISKYQREISLDLTFPAEFKFTRGKWESEAIINKIYNQPNIVISNQPNKTLQYSIQGWTDQLESYSTYSNFLIKTLHSNILNQDRKIYISLPENYSKDTKYPVFYITDAQNLNNFEIANQTLRQQSNFGNFPETILVGIYQSDRNGDFGLNDTTYYNTDFQNYIFKELIPYINKNYSTSSYKAIIGHSNGSEYNHFLMFAKTNPFDAFANISEELNLLPPYREQEWYAKSKNAYKNFFKNYNGKPIKLFIASGKYDISNRLEAGKIIDSLYRSNPNKKITYTQKLYPAEHNSLVAKSMLDAQSFIFKDYKNFESFETELNKTNNYKQSITDFLKKTNQYGDYKISDEDQDIIETIMFNTKNFELFKQWNEVENSNNQLYSNLFLGIILTDIDPIKASEYFEKAIVEKDKDINKFLSLFVYNEVQVLKKPKNAIIKLENILKYSPNNTLEINYFIAKICIENNIYSFKGKKSLEYCNNHFTENRYFTKDDLQKLKNK
jgi:predicted alpha/beta superfamily hydrolase